jgi:hypothetical protein
MKYFKVKSLDKWQHYKDRRPPWIKLHSEILDDYKFTNLKDKEKCHLMLLWLLASQCDNKLPYDPDWITKKLYLSEKINLSTLESLDFIEVYQDASIVIADCKQVANVETETEAEAEAEAETEMTAIFKKWLAYRKDLKRKDQADFQLKALNRLSGGNPTLANEIVNQSIGNGWKGLFEIKQQTQKLTQRQKEIKEIMEMKL